MKQNLVLIGMPGSGKTTIGLLLSQHLNLSYIDIDAAVEEKSKKKISQLFEVSEEHFRNVETAVTKEIAQKENVLISTGGGVILREENMKALRETGLVLFIDRPVEKIAEDVVTETRPLLREEGLNSLKRLYTERVDLYHKYADIIVENQSTPEEVIEKIKEKLPNSFSERTNE